MTRAEFREQLAALILAGAPHDFKKVLAELVAAAAISLPLDAVKEALEDEATAIDGEIMRRDAEEEKRP